MTRYNMEEWIAGRITEEHLDALTRIAQKQFGLKVDGELGPITRAHLLNAGITNWPLAPLDDGRKPHVTSAYRTKDRPTHNGVDLFYEYLDSDPPMKAGDGGAVVVKGDRRWWIPPGTVAVAAGAGTVQQVGVIGTGQRVWVDHGRGFRTGYFHLSKTYVLAGERVAAGQALGVVGDNPNAFDATHLHFEVSPTRAYEPMDPEPFLRRIL